MQRKMHKIALVNFLNDPKILFLIFDTHNWESKPIYLFLTVFHAIICINAINIEGLRTQELLGYVLRFTPLCFFEFHSDLTIVFRSFDYLGSTSFTAFHKRTTYLIYFSLPKNENDLQFSINLRLITFDQHQMINIIRKLIKFCILHNRFFSIWVW